MIWLSKVSTFLSSSQVRLILILRLFEGVKDYGVGAVDGGGVEAGEVDPGRGLAVMAHAFADY